MPRLHDMLYVVLVDIRVHSSPEWPEAYLPG